MNSKPNKRVRKPKEVIQEALTNVLEGKMSIRLAAREFNVAKSMLARLVAKAKVAPPDNPFIYEPNIGNRRIFTVDEEESLSSYLKISSKMAYGLTYVQTRELAFQYAIKLEKNIPNNWTENKKAGVDWMKQFMKRHTDLSLRHPEKTSLSRATAFNPTTVGIFFGKLEQVLTKYSFTADRIFNADETGLTTVSDLPCVIAERGSKQVGQVTSAERGQLVTMLAFVSATGNHVPPVFIFPRIRFKDFMVEGCPAGSLGLCNSSGWMTSANFQLAFKHFVGKVKASKESPVLLLLDNHESHVNIDVIDYAREKGVVILTFPPHCSHKLQPLDVAVFGPFKNYFKAAQNDWMVTNPGKTISIYHLPKFATSAFNSAFTPKNICSGFAKAGIHPFNKNSFGEQDFLAASVTDHPDPNIPNKSLPSCSTETPMGPEIVTPAGPAAVVSLANIRPFPKAPPRQPTKRGRKRGSSRVITETPEKDEIEQSCAVKKAKQNQATRNIFQKKIQMVKKTLVQFSSSESGGEEDIDYAESDESFELEDNIEAEEEIPDIKSESLNTGDFIVVKFIKKKLVRHFVGEIMQVHPDNNITVKFLKKSYGGYQFVYDSEDVADIERQDIVRKLPPPVKNKGSARVNAFLSFKVDLSALL